MIPDTMQFSILRKQIGSRKIVVGNILNLSRTIFKEGKTVRYNVEGANGVTKAEVGTVRSVERQGSEVYIHVKPLVGKRHFRVVRVDDVIGVMNDGE